MSLTLTFSSEKKYIRHLNIIISLGCASPVCPSENDTVISNGHEKLTTAMLVGTDITLVKDVAALVFTGQCTVAQGSVTEETVEKTLTHLL